MPVLFVPEFEQPPGQPAAVGEEFVDDGMAGRAESDEPLDVVDARPPVVDGAVPYPAECPAPLALMPVAEEDLVAEAGEGAEGVLLLAVAGGAEAGNFG
jgi:hypothetical protein